MPAGHEFTVGATLIAMFQRRGCGFAKGKRRHHASRRLERPSGSGSGGWRTLKIRPGSFCRHGFSCPLVVPQSRRQRKDRGGKREPGGNGRGGWRR